MLEKIRKVQQSSGRALFLQLTDHLNEIGAKKGDSVKVSINPKTNKIEIERV